MKALRFAEGYWYESLFEGGIAICFHAPTQLICYLIGVPVGMYLTDFIVGSLLRTYRIDSSSFSRLERSVELTFEHPPGFSTDGTGYVLVCLPWISKHEWHAFSLFSHPSQPNHSCVCMAVGGDWTKRLHDLVERPTHRPAWVSGPFASPYATAVEYDNLILVASGIGITPAMSIITTYKETRRANLVWACRDASLLEFYLDKCRFPDDGWTLVFYTGKRKLQLPHELAPTVLIFHGRPDLPHIVREIILGVESRNGLPEDFWSMPRRSRRIPFSPVACGRGYQSPRASSPSWTACSSTAARVRSESASKSTLGREQSLPSPLVGQATRRAVWRAWRQARSRQWRSPSSSKNSSRPSSRRGSRPSSLPKHRS